MQQQKVMKYGVAEGEKVIGDLYDTVEQATRHLAYVRGTQSELGIDREVRIVTVEATTSFGRPHVYQEPAPEVEPAPEPAPVEAP